MSRSILFVFKSERQNERGKASKLPSYFTPRRPEKARTLVGLGGQVRLPTGVAGMQHWSGLSASAWQEVGTKSQSWEPKPGTLVWMT